MLLPNGYTQIEYIQSSGTQYIDTGFIPNNKTKIEVVFERDTTEAFYLYGVSSSDNTKSVTAYLTSAAGNWRFGAAYKSLTIPINEQYTAIVDSSGIIVNNVSNSYSGVIGAFTATQNLIICANISETGEISSSRFVGKIYYFKIYDNGTLIRDFVPCKNASGVAGLYDAVNGAFYTDAAGGTFTAGLEVSPSYKLVDANELDSAMTVTANAIRAKTGDTSGITWDSSTGFASAIEAIRMGAKVATGSMTQGADFQLSTGGIFVQGIGFKANKIILYRTSEMFSLLSLSTGSYFISCLESGAEKDNITNSYLCHVVAYLQDAGGNNYITTLNNIFVVAAQGGVAIFQDSDGVDNIYMAAGTYNWIAIG